MPSGFLTQARRETGADKPPGGGANGRYLSSMLLANRASVFGVTAIRFEEQGGYLAPGQRGPAPDVWRLDVVPFYSGETLPVEDENGRIVGVDVGTISFQHGSKGRDRLMTMLQEKLETGELDLVGPAMLAKIKTKAGRNPYIDLVEYDPETDGPVVADDEQAVSEEEEAPVQRPSSRPPAPRPAQQQEVEPEGEAPPRTTPPARSRTTGRQAGASASRTAPAPARRGRVAAESASEEGEQSRPFDPVDQPATEPAVPEAPEYADQDEFPGPKAWARAHGFEVTAGPGRLAKDAQVAYEAALDAWKEWWQHLDVDAEPGPEPEPAEQAPRVVTQEAEVPGQALHQDQDRRPADAPIRPQDKTAFLPPDEIERQAQGGRRAAKEQVYQPSDEGRSVEPCPGGCGPNGVPVHVTGRAFKSGNRVTIVHQCPADGQPRPMEAVLTGRKV